MGTEANAGIPDTRNMVRQPPLRRILARGTWPHKSLRPALRPQGKARFTGCGGVHALREPG